MSVSHPRGEVLEGRIVGLRAQGEVRAGDWRELISIQ